MNKRKRMSSFRPVRENQEIIPSTDFLTLNDDCLYKIFDWLSLEELTCVNMTCKRLQTVSGVYFEREYQLLKLTITRPNYGEHIKYKPDEEQFPYVKQFKRHFKTVQLEGGNIRLFRHAAMLFQNKSIKHLYLNDFSVNIEEWKAYGLRVSYGIQYGEIIKDILKNVVTLQTNVIDADNLHDIFLKHCLHLENLIINRNGTDGFSNTLPLFNQTYPTLRQFLIKISPEASEKLWVDLQRFIENNTSLEVLFYFEQGKQCRNLIPLIQNHDLKVKELALRLFPAIFDCEEAKMLLNENCEILSALKDKNNYEKLQLIIGNKQVLLSAPHMLQSLKNLHKVYMIPEKMYIEYDQSWKEYLCDQSISILSTLVHTETLLIKKLKRPTHAEILAKGLVNLNEIFIHSENIEVILPFVRYSPKLTMIYIFVLYEQYLYPQENPNNLNVTTLIRERNKLSNATPLKIYVHRHLFLKMKRPATFFTNDTVEIKRIESYSLRNPAILDSIIGAGYAGFY
ncbi:uncharacterized protein LOC129571864 [Sitodiplosis mosellana]|uniref:uncharacterized protein LOC129571864 n=1 Tax=Sitodiplosis mosellana TaxID=263140 RepID=UPI0024443E2B|nr:uncharacterized protein LOC129571864 [Sitodiplosis mosellana]XP_055307710.1 uncharacterized protein LOC129571864 [Sitodiplosis mosellana]XP_055307711.1 uncharacterized protein LOC129571864 [Sitodiplosis mosellana]